MIPAASENSVSRDHCEANGVFVPAGAFWDSVWTCACFRSFSYGHQQYGAESSPSTITSCLTLLSWSAAMANSSSSITSAFLI
jgi:hypothetical protein